MRQDQNVGHCSRELVEKLKVDVSLAVLLLGCGKLRLESLPDGPCVVRLCSKLSNRDFAMVIFSDLLQKVFCLVHNHRFNLEGEAPVQDL